MVLFKIYFFNQDGIILYYFLFDLTKNRCVSMIFYLLQLNANVQHPTSEFKGSCPNSVYNLFNNLRLFKVWWYF